MEVISSRYFSPKEHKEFSETLDSWRIKIEKADNFSFIKFGDGEFICMSGEFGKRKRNTDKHPYSKELGDKLQAAWLYLNSLDNIYLIDWAGHKATADLSVPEDSLDELIKKTKVVKAKFVNQEILIQNTLSESKFNLFKTIKHTKRKKIFIGPARLSGVIDFLNINKFIEVPLINSFSEYDEILDNALSEIEDNCIVLLSAGMPAKSIIHKLIESNQKITCLDIGSGFDTLFVGNTRKAQLDPRVVKDYYINLYNTYEAEARG